MARRRRNGLARRNKFEEISSSRLRLAKAWNCRAKAGRGSRSNQSGTHPAWQLATRYVILRRWGSHSAIIVIGSENIRAGTGLSGAGLFLKATAVR